MTILVYLLLLCFGYLAVTVGYLLLSAVAGWLRRKADDQPLSATPDRWRRIAVLIPAYKEDAVILESVRANRRQQYPASAYDLYVIADSFRPDTIRALAQLPVQVLEVRFEHSTVQKSLQYALDHLPVEQYDIVVVADADNHLAPDFLARINAAFGQGWRAVQGHRVAKNTNTSVAILDAMNEEVNNHLFRQGQRALGLSASLIGSGMAFEPAAMKAAMRHIRSVGGYDKELEMNLMLAGFRIAYLKQAYVYDEKVQNLEVFERQRTRWVAAQVQFVRHYFGAGMRALMRGNWHAANGLLKNLLFPRTLLLAVLVAGTGLALLSGSGPWLAGMATLLGGLLLVLFGSIPAYLWRLVSVRELLMFPRLLLRMVRSLFRLNTARKKFIHTPHGTVEKP